MQTIGVQVAVAVFVCVSTWMTGLRPVFADDRREADDATLVALFARFEQEPSIAAVQDRALRYFRLHPSMMDALVARASRRAAVPRVRLAYTFDRYAEGESYVGSGASLAGQSAQNDTDKTAHIATAELSWDFAGLAYDPAELLALDATPKQFELIRDVTRVFFERRDALLTLELAPPADPLVRAQLRLAVQERIALLDAMTGGWYRRALNAAAAR